MTFYRRRLPHLFHDDQPIFLTWCLHGSLPPNRVFPRATLTSGQAFAALDRLLDEARTGPFYLKQPAIAALVVAAIHHSADALGQYILHAFVVMPNHVHMLVSPQVPLPQLTKTLKTFTARRANQALDLTGKPFWQDESYDRLVRDQREFDRIHAYIENNPVRAGLAQEPSEFLWSSARGEEVASQRSAPLLREVVNPRQRPQQTSKLEEHHVVRLLRSVLREAPPHRHQRDNDQHRFRSPEPQQPGQPRD